MDNETHVALSYPQHTVQDPHEEITIVKVEFLEESLMTFYHTCKEGLKLIVEVEEHNVKLGKNYHPGEWL